MSLRLNLAGLLSAVLISVSSFAATPTSGTVNPTTNSSTTWTSSAVGATNGESTCVEGVTCDTFTLTISGNATNYKGKYVNISIKWSLPVNDYDLYVHKGSLTGPVVASSTNGVPGTSEAVSIIPTTLGVGVYSVHVVASAVSAGDAPKGTAVVALAPVNPPAEKVPAPTFMNYQSPTGLGDSSGEPSIGLNWNSGNIMTSAVLDTLGQLQHVNLSSNGNMGAQGQYANEHHHPGSDSVHRSRDGTHTGFPVSRDHEPF